MALDDDSDRIRTERSGSPCTAGSASVGSSQSGEGSTNNRSLPPPLPVLGRIKSFGSLTTRSCSALQSTWIQRLRPATGAREEAQSPHVTSVRAYRGSCEPGAHRELRSPDVRPEERLSRSPHLCCSNPGFRSDSTRALARSHGAHVGREVFVSSPPDCKTRPQQRFFQGGCFTGEAGKVVSFPARKETSHPGHGEYQRDVQDYDNCNNKGYLRRFQSPAQMQENFPFSPESLFAPIRQPLTATSSKVNSERPHIVSSSSEVDVVKHKGKAGVGEETGKLTSVCRSLGCAQYGGGTGGGASDIDRSGRQAGSSRLIKFSPVEQSSESNSVDTASTESLPKELFLDLYLQSCSRSIPKVCETCKIEKLGIKNFDSMPNDDATSIGVATNIDPVMSRGRKSNDNVRVSLGFDIGNRPGCFGEGMCCEVQCAFPSSGVKNVPSSMDLPHSFDICGPSASSLLMVSNCNDNGASQSLALEHCRDLIGKAAHGKYTHRDKGLHLPLLKSHAFLAAKENHEYIYQGCSNEPGNVKYSSDFKAGVFDVVKTTNLWASSFEEKPLQNRSTLDGSHLKGPFQGSLRTAATEFVRSLTELGKESGERHNNDTQGNQPCSSSLMWLQHWRCSSLSAAQQLKLCPEPKEKLKSQCTIKASMDGKSPDAFRSSRILEDVVTDGPSERDQDKGDASDMTSPEKNGIETACKLQSFPEYGSCAQVDSGQPGTGAMSMIGSARQQVCTFIFGGKHAGAKRTSKIVKEESTQEKERQRPG